MAEASGKVLSAFSKLGIIAVTAVTFTLGLLGTVYFSLRSPEIQVPEVVNKSYVDGTAILNKAGLDIRQRAQRYKPDVQPGIILDQSPRAGEVVKGGQTVAVVVSRGPREGEQPPVASEEPEKRNDTADNAKPEGAEAASNTPAKNGNQNQNRERRKNTNKNANAGSRNANNSNQNGGNANATQRNQNGGLNTNRNANRTLNTNANGAGGANRNHNANANANRNTNSARPAGGANRRPPF